MSIGLLSKKRTTTALVNDNVVNAERIDITNLQLPRKFKEASALIYANQLHVLGDTYHYKYENGEWVEASTIPYSMFYDTAAIWFTNQLFILADNGSWRNTYRWQGTKWEIYESAKLFDTCHVMYAHVGGGGNLYAVGKHNSSSSFNFYKLSSGWSNQTNIPYDFRDGAAVFFNSAIHVIGSSIESDSKKHYRWDGSSWINTSTLPKSVHYGKAVVYDNKIYVFNENGECLIWNGSSWTEGTSLDYGMKYGSVIVYDNKIYYMGGENNPKAFLEYNSQDKICGISL